jgi:hypothetical protein
MVEFVIVVMLISLVCSVYICTWKLSTMEAQTISITLSGAAGAILVMILFARLGFNLVPMVFSLFLAITLMIWGLARFIWDIVENGVVPKESE